MLRIRGRASSGNVLKVLRLPEALSVPWERVGAGGAFGVALLARPRLPERHAGFRIPIAVPLG